MSKHANNTFTAEQLNELRASYDTMPERIPYDAADKLLALLDRVSPAMMQQLADAEIRFISSAAKGRLLRMDIKPLSSANDIR